MKSPNNSNVDVTTICKPLFVMMSVFGLYFPRRDRENTTINRRRFQMLYCFLCNAVLWSNSARFAVCFKKFQAVDEDVLLQISFLIYSVSVCALLSTFTVTSSSAWPAFLCALQQFHDTYGSPKYALGGRRKLWSVIAISVLSFFPVMCFVNYNILTSQEVQSGQLCSMFPFQISNPVAYSIFAAFHVFVTFFMGFAFLIVELVVFSTGYILYKEFVRVGQKMRKALSSDDDTGTSKAVESVRRQYEDVVGLLQKGNRLFIAFALLQYATSIPYVCLVVYSLVRGAYSVETILTSIAGSMGLISINVVVTCCGILINSQVRQLSVLMKEIKDSGTSIQQSGEHVMAITLASGKDSRM